MHGRPLHSSTPRRPGRPSARLGLHRVVGRQRPHHRRLPDVGVRLPLHRVRRPGDGRARRRRATCSSRATSASSCPARSTADSPIAEHVRRHGDGVHDLAWLVDDADAAFAAAVARGARAGARAVDGDRRPRRRCASPRSRPTATPCTRSSTAAATPARCSSPATRPTACRTRRRHRPVGLTRIDHVVGNVEQGELDDWVRFYADVLGFAEHAALRRRPDPHRVLGADVDGRVGRLEDRHADQRAGRRAAQEPDPGVHRALRRRPACSTSRCAPTTSSPRSQALRDRGVRFMQVPDTYYDDARERLAGSTCRGTRCSG